MNAAQEMGARTLPGSIVFRFFINRTDSTFVQKISRDFIERGHRTAENALLRQDDNSPRSLARLDFTSDGAGGEVNNGHVIGWSVSRVKGLAIG